MLKSQHAPHTAKPAPNNNSDWANLLHMFATAVGLLRIQTQPKPEPTCHSLAVSPLTGSARTRAPPPESRVRMYRSQNTRPWARSPTPLMRANSLASPRSTCGAQGRAGARGVCAVAGSLHCATVLHGTELNAPASLGRHVPSGTTALEPTWTMSEEGAPWLCSTAHSLPLASGPSVLMCCSGLNSAWACSCGVEQAACGVSHSSWHGTLELTPTSCRSSHNDERPTHAMHVRCCCCS